MRIPKILYQPTKCMIKKAGQLNSSDAGWMKSSFGSRCLCVIAVPVGAVEVSIKGVVGIAAKVVSLISFNRLNVRPMTRLYDKPLQATLSALMLGIVRPKNAASALKGWVALSKEGVDTRVHVADIVRDTYLANMATHFDPQARSMYKNRLCNLAFIPLGVFSGIKHAAIQVIQVSSLVRQAEREEKLNKVLVTQAKIMAIVSVVLSAPLEIVFNNSF